MVGGYIPRYQPNGYGDTPFDGASGFTESNFGGSPGTPGNSESPGTPGTPSTTATGTANTPTIKLTTFTATTNKAAPPVVTVPRYVFTPPVITLETHTIGLPPITTKHVVVTTPPKKHKLGNFKPKKSPLAPKVKPANDIIKSTPPPVDHTAITPVTQLVHNTTETNPISLAHPYNTFGTINFNGLFALIIVGGLLVILAFKS